MSLFRFPRCVRPARGISTPALSSFVPPFACGHTHSSTKGGLGLPENHLRGSKVPPHGNFFSHTCPIVWPPDPRPPLAIRWSYKNGGRKRGNTEHCHRPQYVYSKCIPKDKLTWKFFGNFRTVHLSYLSAVCAICKCINSHSRKSRWLVCVFEPRRLFSATAAQ